MEIPSDREERTAAAVVDYRSKVDSSRPFSSVKEAVALFGERFLAGEICSPKPFAPSPKQESWRFSPFPPPAQDKGRTGDYGILEDTIEKLRGELEETKRELRQLKERGSETEVAVASLNVELHRNMSKLAKAEAAAAGRAAAARPRMTAAPEADSSKEKAAPSVAQVLSVGDDVGYFPGEERERERARKLKPIIPLVGDLFHGRRRKETSSSPAALRNSVISTPHHASFG